MPQAQPQARAGQQNTTRTPQTRFEMRWLGVACAAAATAAVSVAANRGDGGPGGPGGWRAQHEAAETSLCNTPASHPEMFQVLAKSEVAISELAPSAAWGSCCTDPARGASACRFFEPRGAYCGEAFSPEACGLDAADELVINIAFDENAKEECCETSSSTDAGSAASAWVRHYCDALKTNGVLEASYLVDAGTDAPPQTETLSETKLENLRSDCIAKVETDGWTEANAHFSGSGSEQRTPQLVAGSTNISDYHVDLGTSCDDGVFIDVFNEDIANWAAAYFIPRSRAPLSGSLLVTGADAPALFLNEIRLRQCDIRLNAACSPLAASVCRPAHGVTLGLVFSNPAARVHSLWKSGEVCGDVAAATTACLPDGLQLPSPASDARRLLLADKDDD